MAKSVLIWGLVLVVASGCADSPQALPEAALAAAPARFSATSIDPPAGSTAMAPRWAVGSAIPTLSWVETAASGEPISVWSAGWDGGAWSSPAPVVADAGVIANFADVPVLAMASSWYALWPQRLGDGPHDYGVEVAHRPIGAADQEWSRLGFVHDDTTPSEYGFPSPVQLPDGGLRVFWLDGRAMPGGGAMALNSARIFGEEIGPNETLDARVCECCATDAAWTPSGAAVVYRDRSDDEHRDIAVVRETKEGWSQPVLVARDDWQIQGCPVNGPAIDAAGEQVAVAWFSAPRNLPRVRVALSSDGAASFAQPLEIATGEGVLGRVDVVFGSDGSALVTWVQQLDRETAEVRGRWISATGTVGPAEGLAPTSARRAGGFPRLIAVGDDFLLAAMAPAESGGTTGEVRLRVTRLGRDGV